MNFKALAFASGLAGIGIGILSGIPIISWVNCLFCGWVILGSMGSTFLYKKFSEDYEVVQAPQGALVGALSGLVGAVVGTIVSFSFSFVLNLIGFGLDTASGADDFGFSTLLSGAGSLIGLVINIFAYPIFGAIGGLIGGAIFGRSADGTIDMN